MNKITFLTFLFVLLFASFWLALAQSGGDYAITSSTIDNGGGTSSGGDYTLSGTIGQWDVAPVSGGSYSLTSGFWQSAPAPVVPTAVQVSQVSTSTSLIGILSFAAVLLGVIVILLLWFGQKRKMTE